MSANVAEGSARSTAPMAGVFIATLACFVSVGCVLPILPRYVHGPLHSGDLATGVVVGAFAISAVVARPLAGRQTDVLGRRLVFAAGAVAMAVGAALMFVPAGLPGAIVARLVFGVGEGTLFTAGSVWAIDLAPPERRGRAIAWFGLAVWGGLSAGPAIGEGLKTLGGYDAVWVVATVAPLVGAAIAWREPHDRPPPHPPGPRPPLIDREAVAPGIALTLVNAGYATLASFVGLKLAGDGGTIVFSAFAVSVVVARLTLGGLADRYGPLRTGLAAAVAEAVGLAVIALARGWPVAVAGAVVMAVGFALFYPALALWVVRRVDERRRGTALGTFTAFFDAGFGLGAPIAGATAALGGYDAAFWVACGYGAIAALLTVRLARRR